MKKALKYLALLPFLGAVACGGPKVIPEDTLSDVLLDIFLVNAYSGNLSGMNYDSIDIYEPILNDYGYTSRDFTHTLANFTKRKSARLSQVIDASNDKLDKMLASLNRQIEKEDYIDSLAWALTMKTVYTDSLIQVRKMADTARLRIRIPVEEGIYKISYNYLQDTTDKNNGLQNRHSIIDRRGRQQENTTQRIVRGREIKDYQTKLTVGAEADSLELLLGGYRESHKETPHYTVDSLYVVWMPPKEQARREYLKQFIDTRVFIDSVEITDIIYGYYLRDTAAVETLTETEAETEAAAPAETETE